MPADGPDDRRPWLPDNLKVLPPELAKRIGSGLVIGAVALVMLYVSPKAFAALVALVAAAMSWEWGRIVRPSSPDAATAVHALATALAAALTSADMPGHAIATCIAGALTVAALTYAAGQAQLSGLGVFYTGLPVVALLWLRSDETLGFLATLYVVLTVIATDTAAYAAGRTIGGPKLWPAISPNKTWSGLLGGIGAAAVTGALFTVLTGSGAPLWLASLGFVMGLVAQAGDLAESALKRHFGVKDSGDLIPGHGGFMDRMDGIVTASIAAALVAFSIDAFAPAGALLYGP